MQLEELFDSVINSRLEAVHTAFPAIVQSYDGHAKRTCTVVPATHTMLSDGTILEALPISGVPVIFPSCQAGGLIFPIKSGDMVLVVVSESGIGTWLKGEGQTAMPDDPTRFTMHDAIAIPGIWPMLSVPKTKCAASSAMLEFNGSTIEMKKDGSVLINGNLEILK